MIGARAPQGMTSGEVPSEEQALSSWTNGAVPCQSAENEGRRFEGKLLPAGGTLLPDQADRFDLLQTPPRHSEARRTIADCG